MSVRTLDHHSIESTVRHPHVPARSSGGPITPHARAIALHGSAGNAAVGQLVASRGAGHTEAPSIARFSLGGLFDDLGGLSPIAGSLVNAGVGALGGAIGGDLGGIVSQTGQGLGSAASQFVGGDSQAALSTLQGVGSSVANPLATTGFGMLGSALGGSAGSFLGGLGQPVGAGLTSVIGGGDPAEAGMGVLDSALPGLLALAQSFLSGH